MRRERHVLIPGWGKGPVSRIKNLGEDEVRGPQRGRGLREVSAAINDAGAPPVMTPT